MLRQNSGEQFLKSPAPRLRREFRETLEFVSKRNFLSPLLNAFIPGGSYPVAVAGNVFDMPEIFKQTQTWITMLNVGFGCG
jgi:hypothetical protein